MSSVASSEFRPKTSTGERIAELLSATRTNGIRYAKTVAGSRYIEEIPSLS